MFLPSLGLYWPYLQHFNFKIKMGGFFVTILQYLYILNVFIFPCSPFWLTCNVNIVLSSKVMLLSLCLHYTWLYYLYHICFLLFLDSTVVWSLVYRCYMYLEDLLQWFFSRHAWPQMTPPYTRVNRGPPLRVSHLHQIVRQCF